MHDPVKYLTDRVANINKQISISIKFPDGMKIVKRGISLTESSSFITRLSRHVRFVACQRLNILRNSLRQSCREEPTNSARNCSLSTGRKNVLPMPIDIRNN